MEAGASISAVGGDLKPGVGRHAPRRRRCHRRADGCVARLGRRYSDVVSLRGRRSSESGRIDCTVPLPNVRLPTTAARPCVLQAGGDDLRRAGRQPVDEHRHRHARRARARRSPAAARAHRAVAVAAPAAGRARSRRRRETVADIDGRRRAAHRDCRADRARGPGGRSWRRSRRGPPSSSAAVRSPKLVIRTRPIPGSPSTNQSHVPSGRRRSPSTLSVLIDFADERDVPCGCHVAVVLPRGRVPEPDCRRPPHADGDARPRVAAHRIATASAR